MPKWNDHEWNYHSIRGYKSRYKIRIAVAALSSLLVTQKRASYSIKLTIDTAFLRLASINQFEHKDCTVQTMSLLCALTEEASTVLGLWVLESNRKRSTLYFRPSRTIPARSRSSWTTSTTSCTSLTDRCSSNNNSDDGNSNHLFDRRML